jgi:superfamily II DNA or RNA helicase
MTTLALRPYQSEGIERARAAAVTHRKLCLVLPTGGGKTVIAAAIIAGAVSRGKKVLFLAHRRELINQTCNKLRDAGVANYGVILAQDNRNFPLAPVQVASVQTLVRRVFPPADLVFIDEAQHSNATSYQKIIDAYPSAKILGLTATPVRDDGRGLSECYDAMEVIASPRDLIDGGYLAEPRVFSSREALDLSNVTKRGGDYSKDELATTMDRPRLVGDIVQHWIKLAHDRSTVVFAVSVKHSQSIVAAFREFGVNAEHLDGETPVDEREAILARLASGETEVVSNCGVLTEGWDLPRCKCVILARPTQSLSLYIQMGGRGLRPYNGITPIILDHGECVKRHGLPHQTRDWEGYFSAKKRKSTGESVSVKNCPTCFAMLQNTVKTCPECGYIFAASSRSEVEQVDESLVEIRDDFEQQREGYRSILKTAARGGMQLGFARHRYRERFGDWPSFPGYRELEIERYPLTRKLEGLPSWLSEQLGA